MFESLPMAVDQLIRYDLKDRVKVIVSARGFMFALGCVKPLKCNKNTCPKWLKTHNKGLQSGLVPKEKYFRVATQGTSKRRSAPSPVFVAYRNPDG